MGKYIVKRILQVIPMLFILSLIVFMMVRLIPGDPVDMMLGMDIPKDTKEYERERLGLNDPLYIQYFRFVGNALHGDLGTSIFSGKPVVEELAKRFPKTLTLAVGGTLFGAAGARTDVCRGDDGDGRKPHAHPLAAHSAQHPLAHHRADDVHLRYGDYLRSIAELPWRGHSVALSELGRDAQRGARLCLHGLVDDCISGDFHGAVRAGLQLVR